MGLKKRELILFGIFLPIILLIIGMMIIMNAASGASSNEFSGLGVFL